MKYLTAKYFANLEKSLVESNERALSTRLSYIEKIREDESLRKPINDSVYLGSLLTKLLDCIPKEILKDNVGTKLFEFEEDKKTTEEQRIFRQYSDFFLVSDTTKKEFNINRPWDPFEDTKLENLNFYIFRPHKDFLNISEYKPSKNCFGYALNSEGQIQYMKKYFGKLKIDEEVSKQYLTTYLTKDNILLEDFVKQVSEKLIKIAEKGRTNESLLKETLHNISILPEDWIMEKLKK